MDSCKYELYNKELRFEEPNRCLSLVRKTVQLSGRFFFKVAGCDKELRFEEFNRCSSLVRKKPSNFLDGSSSKWRDGRDSNSRPPA